MKLTGNKESKRIHRIISGDANMYLIRGADGYILVDAGCPKTERAFARSLKKLGIHPTDIKLAVITHVHFDHVGILASIKELCDCPVVVHESESDLLRKGVTVIPPGINLFGKVVGFLGETFKNTRFLRFSPVEPDIVVNGDLSLKEFGVDGRIIHTPGHSSGSISVLLSSGEAFTGDLATKTLPGTRWVFPPFVEDENALFSSWKRLIDHNVESVMPGHYRAFGKSTLASTLNKFVRPAESPAGASI